MRKCVLAIDLGTSSVRAMLVDENGKIIHKEQTKYGVIRVSKYMQEQDPDEIYRNFAVTVRRCMDNAAVCKEDVKAISFSSQMYNIFPVNGQGRPLYNMILWSDSRSEKQAEQIAASCGKGYLYKETGCPLNSIYPLSKIMWLRENEEEITEQTCKYISVKEYILEKIIGEYIVDYSMATATGIFNVHTLQWDDKALGLLGVSKDWFSRPVSGLEVFGVKNTSLAEELGISPDIRVISGGGDGPLANIGSGASFEGNMNIDLGTSGAARVMTDRPIIDSEQRMWTYAVTESEWVYGGILSNVGNGYQWLMKNIAEFSCEKNTDKIYEIMDEKIKELPSVQADLLFVPYLIKCKSPYWDDRVKATIYGLTHEHTFADIAKAYLESIGFDMLSLINIINEKVQLSPRLILTGGLAQSENICQMLSDILGKEIVTLSSSEGSIMGAAIFALKAIGCLKDLHIPGELDVRETYEPDMQRHDRYQKSYVKYLGLRSAVHDLNL